MKDTSVTHPDHLVVVPAIERFSPIASHSERTNKRDFSDAMETKKEDTTQTSKNKKVEEEGQMVQVTETKGRKKQMKFKGPALEIKGPIFEIKEYAFSETPKDSTSQFKTRVELFDKYREDKEVSTNESLELYGDVKKISSKDVSLVTIRDHAKNTLT